MTIGRSHNQSEPIAIPLELMKAVMSAKESTTVKIYAMTTHMMVVTADMDQV